MRSTARWLLYLGIVGVVATLGLVHARLIADPPYSYTGTFRFGWSLLYVVVLVLTSYGFGLPDLTRTPKQALVTSIGAAGSGALVMSALQLLSGDALLPRFVVFGSAIMLVPWYVICVALTTDRSARSASRDRVLVVGDDIDAVTLRAEVERSAERMLRLVAVVPVPEVEAVGDGRQPLVEMVHKQGISVVVLDRDAQGSTSLVAQAAELHRAGTRVRTLSLFYEEWLGMLPLAELERTSLFFDIGEVHRARYGRIKRVLDVFVSGLGVIALAVMIPFVVLGNVVGNRGSLFYRQDRVGKDGRTFRIVKFRTMVAATGGQSDTSWTASDDPRITPFGRLLRTTHLDELPQVVNILRGDLSVVGPRPEQPHYVEELVEKLPYYEVRHMVRPGLTGWAQVKYGYAGDEADALEKLQYDFYYLRRQGLGLDLRIIGRTIRSVLGREGR
jgi:lipopolysaccharide/colanic/teichoic acid biosynthesis glycosyltransferase